MLGIKSKIYLTGQGNHNNRNSQYQTCEQSLITCIMSVIHKYITVQIIKYFAIVSALIAIVYIAIDFFEKIDNFMEAGVPLSKAFIYFVCKLPFIMAQTIPVCVLLSVLIVFGLMMRNNEITAIQAGGGSIYYLVKPVLILGIIFTIFLFFLSEAIVPVTMERANSIWLKDVRKESSVITREKNIWMKGNNWITHVKYYNPKTKTIYGITQYGFDDNFKLIRRIDAQKGIFTGKKWIFSNIMEQNLDKKYENYDILLETSNNNKSVLNIYLKIANRKISGNTSIFNRN